MLTAGRTHALAVLLGWLPDHLLPLHALHACVQEQAFEEAQKYKEGKFIIEKARVMKVRASHPASSLPACAACCRLRRLRLLPMGPRGLQPA